ncbi:hypothetical protein V1477_015701 [Vespula maculifrons]|uniref:Ig-like domain-containing protein n=1 Tax=Vespula maculifrons TaxID=7453 RepID=A0ABD2BAY2_VESMC
MENTKSLVIIDNEEIDKYSNEAMSGHLVDLHMQQPPRGEIWVGITCDTSRSKSKLYTARPKNMTSKISNGETERFFCLYLSKREGTNVVDLWHNRRLSSPWVVMSALVTEEGSFYCRMANEVFGGSVE